MGCISLINVQSVFCRIWLAKQVFDIFLNGVDPLSDLVKTGFFGLRLQGDLSRGQLNGPGLDNLVTQIKLFVNLVQVLDRC